MLGFASLSGAVAALAYKTYDAVTTISIENENTGIAEASDGSLPILNWEDEREPINILLLGIDRRPGYDPSYSLTDTIMVASIDPVEKRVVMFSLPRDLEVQYRWSDVKINTVHFYGREEDNRGAGPAAVKEVVSGILGIDIHYFARIDFYGFRQVIDQLGGITIDVPEAVIDYSYPTDSYGYTTVRINTGIQQMNGEVALQYSRVRHGSSDLERAERQQEVLVAAKDKAIDSSLGILTNPADLASFLEIIKDNFLTDIQIDEMIALADLARDIDTSNERSVTSVVIGSPYIYHTPVAGKDWRFYPRDPSWGAIQAHVQEMLTDPFLQDDLQLEAAGVRLENGTVAAGLASEAGAELTSSYPISLQNPVNADRSDYLNTVIYDMTGVKPRTLEFLEKYFNTTAIQPETYDTAETADIVVVLGEDAIE